MKYRKFGKLDFQVSALGFGAMRLPVVNREPNNIDEAEAIRMMRHAWDSGVNYVDTAYGYHGGHSEIVVGKALQDGYRAKVKLATKCPAWMVQTAEDFDKLLDEQCKKLQVDKIDFYLLHGLDRGRWPHLKQINIMSRAERAKADGRIGNFGFSFHDDYDTFKGIIDDYGAWDFCQIQYNYMDIEVQAGTKGLKYAADKGLAVIVMEPVRGGRLAKPPESVQKMIKEGPRPWSAAEWALQWVWNQPEVAFALSGMSTMDQVVENLAAADRSGAGTFMPADLAFVDRLREAYKGLSPVPCTSCRYCMPCEFGVEIPRIFEIYNEAAMFGDAGQGRFMYRGASPRALKPEQRADMCTDCLRCVDLCPQKIDIPKWLDKAHEFLGPPPAPAK